MAENLTTAGEERPESGAETAPQRLLREALLLAFVLGACLALAALERHGLVPWPGYPSSLLLLVLSWWHARRFQVRVRLLPHRMVWWPFVVLFSLALVSMLLLSALAPFRPQVREASSFGQMLHLLLLVPLSEEYYFRGLLLEHLRRGFSAVHAVVLCSILFTLLHLPLGAAVVAGILSLVACTLVLKSRGLGYALQLHAAWNGLSQIHGLKHLPSRWSWALLASLTVAAIGIAMLLRRREEVKQ